MLDLLSPLDVSLGLGRFDDIEEDSGESFNTAYLDNCGDDNEVIVEERWMCEGEGNAGSVAEKRLKQVDQWTSGSYPTAAPETW